MVSLRCVISIVRAPVRAAADAASQPAWPPPTTITSASASISPQAGAAHRLCAPGTARTE
eukprot:scaffold18107_cov57-Phaeocystis_antarctica.AAC.4